ncbi:FKBP-type peptidyl-prolyl cis-trans isomerase [Lacibacter sediminis]|uniref:peptidylprolyl isomerase n=1 Tax=Lacibacter sediminis TaxID=2760713 RepID=A0A7G5XCC2_9BACT|nr:FKBP-type peptidyl-prolyl cis-trans isomerase [Lacibacter sediminis]QNA43125.1 FKBP-type peptidyl-prolyl cis-trans isomerase [Lacibacter sediminis]
MKYFLFIMISICTHANVFAQNDVVKTYSLADSLRASGLLVQINTQQINTRKEVKAGVQSGDVKLFIEADKKEKEIVFSFPETATIVAKGMNVEEDGKDELEWEDESVVKETVQLYLATASDSATNFILYSGYVYYPAQNKWKLIGTCKLKDKWGALKSASTFTVNRKKQPAALSIPQAWVQRGNGSFIELSATAAKAPVLAPFSNIDSIQQAANDEQIIQQAIMSGKTDAKQKDNDVYYTIMKEGTGRNVLVTDTVVVYYKGYLLEDGSVFDQTKEKTATFPLSRLIRGWQLGIPFCKVGGKIKIVIPSGLAYSIRTRAAKIPPNSPLVFEVEVIDVKPQL